MNYQKVKYNDVSNGEGIRTSLFVSGCSHKCKGCFNKEAWSYNSGEEFNFGTISDIAKSLEPSHIKGLSVLGGEPFDEENMMGVLLLIISVGSAFERSKDIWVYSGYTFEELIERDDIITNSVLNKIDVLVDGKFEQDLYSPKLRFRGSSNQRIINVKESLKLNKVVLYME